MQWHYFRHSNIIPFQMDWIQSFVDETWQIRFRSKKCKNKLKFMEIFLGLSLANSKQSIFYSFFTNHSNFSKQLSCKSLRYRIVASRSTSRLVTCLGLFRLLMKGIFGPYVLWPFDKKLIFWIVTRVSARDYTVDATFDSVY